MTDTQRPFKGSWGGHGTWMGRRCWPIFRALSMKNCCSEMSTLRLKIAFYAIRSRDACNSQTTSGTPWPRSVKKLGKKALQGVAQIVKPDTILAWQRQLAADKFDGSNQRKS